MVNCNNKEIGVVDLDSCKKGDNKTFPSKFLTERSLATLVPGKYCLNKESKGKSYIIANEDTDLFCYNIMILNYLFGGNVHNLSLEEFYNYLNYLNDLGIYKNLLDIFSKLVISWHNENPVNYLDYLTDEQIYRANNCIYSRVRKK